MRIALPAAALIVLTAFAGPVLAQETVPAQKTRFESTQPHLRAKQLSQRTLLKSKGPIQR